MKIIRSAAKILMPLFLAAIALLVASFLLTPLIAPYTAAYRDAMAALAPGAAAGGGGAALPKYDAGDARVQAFLQSLVKKEVLAAHVVWPEFGDQFATLRIDSVGIDAPVYLGDTPELLKAGVGTYADAGIPGQGRTILMGGHNNTDFLTLPKAAVGSIIEIDATYGVFRYEIVDAKELRFDDPAALDLDAPEENLVLYTCTQSIPGGNTPWRWFVYGRLIEEESGFSNDEE